VVGRIIVGLSRKILLLAIGPREIAPAEPGFLRLLREQGHRVEIRRIAETRSFLQIIQAFRISHDLAKFDLAIATEYFSSFGLCLRSLISTGRTRLAVVSFNVSRRYLRIAIDPIDRAVNFVFRRLSLIVVHSNAERTLFSRMHNLDDQKIAVALWGYDLPESFQKIRNDANRFLPERYICMIGRNNRDFETLKAALHGTAISAIFVAARASGVSLESSDQIRVMYDLSFDACLQIIDHSALNIILLKDATRGAGHITAVSAMMLGKAQLFSNADVLKDYLIADRHGLSAPMGDVNAVRTAISRLLEDAELSKRFGEEAQRYANLYLSNAAFQRRLFDLFVALLDDQKIEIVDKRWKEYLDHNGSSSMSS
jgi:hypothetical protein